MTQSPTPPPALMTVDEVATYLGMTPAAVRQMVYRRQLPFVRLGTRRLRFEVDAINAWLDDQRVEACS